ncbi:MAG: hypothetical protein KKE98_00650 [Nanoarchaeota archaeon]|nr:hypothetical protein [Nanoarchaeota archaeon]
MIKHISLAHGWYYHYRLHTAKMKLLQGNGFSSLHSYLEKVFAKCPQEPFDVGPRSSKLRFDLGIKPRQIDNHEVSHLAKDGLEWNGYNTAHSNVQMFMLNNDSNSIGIEVPIWLKSHEIGKKYEDLFNTKDPLSGHIDVLRLEGNKVWIWDFKPKAEKEKYASTQVFFYSLMLSKRTGIPLNKFMCGYFDQETSYAFKPDMKYLKGRQMKLK